MEQFELALPSANAAAAPAGARQPAAPADVLCGVVASGNLEVLVESHDGSDAQFVIETAADGFRDTWTAVLQEFVRAHAVGGLRFTLNDVGSTPAVVALRLAQAHEQWLQAGQS